jgi:hypothetical protein
MSLWQFATLAIFQECLVTAIRSHNLALLFIKSVSAAASAGAPAPTRVQQAQPLAHRLVLWITSIHKFKPGHANQDVASSIDVEYVCAGAFLLKSV